MKTAVAVVFLITALLCSAAEQTKECTGGSRKFNDRQGETDAIRDRNLDASGHESATHETQAKKEYTEEELKIAADESVRNYFATRGPGMERIRASNKEEPSEVMPEEEEAEVASVNLKVSEETAMA